LDSNKKNLSHSLFYKESIKIMKKLGKKHGFDIPDFNCMSKDGVMYMNITAFEGESTEYYRKWYREHSEGIGMDPQWIEIIFDSFDKSKKLEIIGMDPDGGEKCIKLKDQYGDFYHMTPASVTRLIMEQ